MRRVQSVEALASFQPDDWPKVAVDACRLAIAASGVDDQSVLDALRAVELRRADPDAATLMRSLAERLDEDAWDAQKAGDEAQYDVLFRRSRALSSLAFALSVAQLAEALQRLHTEYSRHHNRRHKRSAHLFRAYCLARRIDDDADLLTSYRYLARNPVAAGLTADPLDWPWASTRAHAASNQPRSHSSTARSKPRTTTT